MMKEGSFFSHLFDLNIFLILEFGGPKSQVISNELHDGGGILVLFFLNVFNISDGIIEGLFG